MQLTVNGTQTELAEGTTVAELLARHTSQRRVAVAVNGQVVSRSAWPHTALADGDDVEMLTAVAGG